MNIHPIRTIHNAVQRKAYQKKTADCALKSLETRYKIPYHSIYKNKNGVVGVLGYPDKVSPYSRALCILPDGTTIETLAQRNIKKSNNCFVDSFTKVVQDDKNHMQIKTSSVKKDAMGRILEVKSDSSGVLNMRRIPEHSSSPDNIIDITEFLKNRK